MATSSVVPRTSPPPDPPLLAVEPQRAVALLEERADGVRFEGIALGPGVYVDATGRRIRVREEHLGLVAERVHGVFLRDLHREDMGASVGVVTAARLDGAEVRFTGDVRLAPYVDIVRNFWPHVRFSLGFRYDPAGLVANYDGTFDLPRDFVIDHLALVPQGQYPNARLVRLLNQARGLTVNLQGGNPVTDDTKELEQLRLQRDEALRAAAKGKDDLEQTRAELGKARADLAAAGKLAEAARLELAQAKNRVAAEVMKLELAAGKDFDLDQRKQELVALELAPLDRLRGELRLAAEQAAGEEEPPEPSTQADRPAEAERPAKGAEALDLGKLGVADTVRLALHQGVF